MYFCSSSGAQEGKVLASLSLSEKNRPADEASKVPESMLCSLPQ